MLLYVMLWQSQSIEQCPVNFFVVPWGWMSYIKCAYVAFIHSSLHGLCVAFCSSIVVICRIGEFDCWMCKVLWASCFVDEIKKKNGKHEYHGIVYAEKTHVIYVLATSNFKRPFCKIIFITHRAMCSPISSYCCNHLSSMLMNVKLIVIQLELNDIVYKLIFHSYSKFVSNTWYTYKHKNFLNIFL
jgi:hypothetical protein